MVLCAGCRTERGRALVRCGATFPEGVPMSEPFAPQLSPPAMAVVRHLALGRLIRTCHFGMDRLEVFDPATGKSKTSWSVSYPALCELVLHGVLASEDHAVTETARDWVAAQAPPARIDHRTCNHPASAAAARRCRLRLTPPAENA
jgi:hypothetical protein